MPILARRRLRPAILAASIAGLLLARTALAQVTLPPGQTPFNVPIASSQNQQFTGPGGIDKTGAGYLEFTAGAVGSDYQGPTNLLAGSIVATGAGVLSPNSAFTLSPGTTLTINGNNTIGSLAGLGGTVSLSSGALTVGGNHTSTTFSGLVTGGGSLIKTGTGTFTLTGATNDYTGGTTINAGTLGISSGTALGTGAVTVNSGGALLGTANLSLAATPALTLKGGSTVSAAAGTRLRLNATYMSFEAGNHVFGSPGNTGVVALEITDGASIPGGNTIEVAYGTLQNADSFLLGYYTSNALSTTVNAGAILDANGASMTVNNLLGAGAVTLGANPASVLTLKSGFFTGVISGAGGVTATGALGSTMLGGHNTYTGDTTVSGGSLRAGTDTNAFGNLSAVTVGATGTLDLAAFNNTIGSLAGAVGARVQGNSPGTTTLTTGGKNTDTTFDGVLEDGFGGGMLALVKTGTGTFTLGGTAANTFTGLTSVTGGTLILAKPDFVAALNGDLSIGNTVSPGAAGSVVVRVDHTNQTSAGTDVTIFTDGLLDGNNSFTHINTLTMTGGEFRTGVGQIALHGDVAILASASGSKITSADFNDNLYLLDATRTFTVADDPSASYDLDVQGGIAHGTLIKAGPGTMRLAGVINSYLTLTLNAGTLALASDTALGFTANSGSPASTFTLAGGTVVADGGDRTIANPISLIGDATIGASLDGTPRALTFSGLITGNDSRTLTVSNDAATTFANIALPTDERLTVNVTGSGDTTIGALTGTLVKDGPGTLFLTGANTDARDTEVRSGTLTITTTGSITPAGPGALEVATLSGSSATLNIAGTVASEVGRIGYQLGAQGTVNVTGGSWTVANDFYVGFFGQGALNLQGGILSDESAYIGGLGASGTATVSGGLWQNNSLGVGVSVSSGVASTLTVQTGGVVQAFFLYLSHGSTLNIGAVASDPAVAAGFLDAPMLLGETGFPTNFVQFNHTATAAAPYWLTSDGSATGTAVVLWNNLQIRLTAGVTAFKDASTYTAGTVIDGGTLLVNNTTGSATGTGFVQVNNGGTLGGDGFITGIVTVGDGGHLAPGNSPGTLTVGELVLSNGSQLDYQLGLPQPPTGTGVAGVDSDLVNIVANLNGSTSTGNLTLDGVLNLSNAGGLNTGIYRLMNYDGSLTGSAADVSLGSVAAGYNFTLDSTTAGQVNLIVDFTGLQFWDGSNLTPGGVANGRGGDGTWNSTNTNWTNQPGSVNNSWADGLTAVFAGTAGTVQVADTVVIAGLQFATDGYVLANGGGSLDVGAAGAELRIDPALTATIEAPLVGLGGITKTGDGKIILTGKNTYEGGTTINAGILSVSQDANLGDVAGGLTFNGGTLEATATFTLASTRAITLAGNGALDVTAANILTYGGVIDGPGSLTKLGSGTLILDGANTFTGDLNVNAGTLLVSDAHPFDPTGTLTLAGGTTFGVVESGSSTIGNKVMLGGDVTLTAVGGTLNLTGEVALGAVTQTVTLVDDSFVTAAGPITGSGGLTLLASSPSFRPILEMTGAASNTYAGLTQVGAGVDLNLHKDPGAVAIQGDLQIDADGLVIVDDRGSATSQIAPTSHVTVNGELLFGGFVADFSQTLERLSGSGFVTNGDPGVGTFGLTLTVRSGNFSGVIREDSGAGVVSLIKEGPDTLVLSGANTYTGNTTVNGGSLIVDGSIASPTTTVNSAGLLGGSGTIGGVLVNYGMVSPGNSPGTLTVSGSYTQNASGTLKIEIGGRNPGEHDLLAVGGAATLGGTLQLVRLNNFQLSKGDRIVFLTAGGGVGGKFATESNEFATGTTVSGKVVYAANDVALEAVQESFASVPDLIEEQFPDLAREFSFLRDLTPNQLAVAKSLDALVKKHGSSKLIDYLNNRPLPELPGDFDRLAPDELTAVFQTAVSLATVQSLNLQRRTDDLRSGANGFSAQGLAINGQTPSYSGSFGIMSGSAGPTGDSSKDSKAVYTPAPDNRWGVFLSGTGEWIDVDGDGNARGYDITTGGFTLGVDYKVTPNFAIGISAGYAGTEADLTNDGRVWVNGGKLGLYATYFTGGFYTDVAVNGGYNSYDTKRGGLEGTARGSTEGGELNVLFGTGYDFKIGALKIGPTATFNYTYVGLDGFDEHGSLAPLSFPDQSGESIRSAFGFRASYDWKIGGLIIKPELRAAWQHEYGDNDYALDSKFANGAGNTFSVRGPKIGRDSLLLGGGFAVQINDRVSTYLYYDGQIARENYDSHSVTGGVRVAF